MSLQLTQGIIDNAFKHGHIPKDEKDTCAYIVLCCQKRWNITITYKQAQIIWDAYSNTRSAQWLGCHNCEMVEEALTEFIDDRLKV